LAVGIAVNVVLNYLWLPVYGLDGAVLATLVSTGVVLGGLWYVMWRLEFAFDGQLVWISLLPLTLLLMPSTGAITSLLIIGLLPQFREAIVEGGRAFAERFGLERAVARR
jgi:O-antigen/teichoic acid export membrane protein